MSGHTGFLRITKTLQHGRWNIARSKELLLQHVRNKTSLEESVGLPPKPKRPLTPYFRFMKQIRPSIVEQNPKANVVEITKLVADHWNKVESAAKQELETEYKQEQEKYVEQKLKYESKLTQEDRQKISEARHDRVVNKERRELKKKKKEFQKPKKNASAFVLWMQTEFKSRGDKPFRTFQLQSAEKWKALSDAEKKPFFDESKLLAEKYRQELLLWEEKMIRLGNTDIIRTESQIEPSRGKTNRKEKNIE